MPDQAMAGECKALCLWLNLYLPHAHPRIASDIFRYTEDQAYSIIRNIHNWIVNISMVDFVNNITEKLLNQFKSLENFICLICTLRNWYYNKL